MLRPHSYIFCFDFAEYINNTLKTFGYGLGAHGKLFFGIRSFSERKVVPSPRIELGSQASQACVLSVELRGPYFKISYEILNGPIPKIVSIDDFRNRPQLSFLNIP